VGELINALAKGIYDKSKENIKRRTYICKSIDEINAALEAHGNGFIKAMWCGEEACEDEVKEKTGAGSRCIPFEQENISDTCVCCGKPAKDLVIWGRAY
jgi:prolyl-tRNA synthetase